MAKRKKPQPTDASFYHAAARWMGVGLEFAIVIAVCAFIGRWLGKFDRQDTSTGGMILGFFVGFAIMMYVILNRAKQTEKELREDELANDQDESEEDENLYP